MYTCAYIYIYIYVHTYTYMYVYIYIYVCERLAALLAGDDVRVEGRVVVGVHAVPLAEKE